MKNVHLIDQIKTEIIVVDADMTIVEANQAFQDRSHKKNCVVGEKCFNAAYNFTESCCYKKSTICPTQKSFLTKKSESGIHHFWIDDHAVVEQLTTTPIVEDNGDVNFVIEEYRDISALLGLKDGIIGICSYCKKIRDPNGQWVTLESYIHKRMKADFSHGICEDCLGELKLKKHSSPCSH